MISMFSQGSVKLSEFNSRVAFFTFKTKGKFFGTFGPLTSSNFRFDPKISRRTFGVMTGSEKGLDLYV